MLRHDGDQISKQELRVEILLRVRQCREDGDGSF